MTRIMTLTFAILLAALPLLAKEARTDGAAAQDTPGQRLDAIIGKHRQAVSNHVERSEARERAARERLANATNNLARKRAEARAARTGRGGREGQEPMAYQNLTNRVAVAKARLREQAGAVHEQHEARQAQARERAGAAREQHEARQAQAREEARENLRRVHEAAISNVVRHLQNNQTEKR